MENQTLSELEQRTLHLIVNNNNILMSALTRRMHSMGLVKEDDRQLVIDVLMTDLKYIDSKTEPFSLGKRGRRAQIWYATDKGKAAILNIIKNNKKTT